MSFYKKILVDKIHSINGKSIILKNIYEKVSLNQEVLFYTKEKIIKGVICLIFDNFIEVIVYKGEKEISIKDDISFGDLIILKVKKEENLVGRIFNSKLQEYDLDGNIIKKRVKEDLEINYQQTKLINPYQRETPYKILETGVSVIDLFMTLIEGQKLAFFLEQNLKYDIFINRILKFTEKEVIKIWCVFGEPFSYITNIYNNLSEEDKKSYIFLYEEKNTSFINNETLLNLALGISRYLSLEKERRVLLLISDILTYVNSLRVHLVSIKIPLVYKNMPGGLYSKLASIYENSVKYKNKLSKGSITLLPLITILNNDRSHPVIDLSGFITEGQIIISEELFKENYSVPINILPSLSRLMSGRIGKDLTREDHIYLPSQTFYLYSEALKYYKLKSIFGEDSLTENNLRIINFYEEFKKEFLNQSEPRKIIESLDKLWEIFRKTLKKSDLDKIPSLILDKYF